MLAGASAVAVGTANFVNPKAMQDIIDDMKLFMIEQRVRDVKEFIGRLKC